jgi:hypothetical protein
MRYRKIFGYGARLGLLLVMAMPAGPAHAQNQTPANAPPPPSALRAAPPSQAELALWQSVENSQNSADYQAYLEKYPDGTFTSVARRRMADLGAEREAQQQQPAKRPGLEETSWGVVFWSLKKPAPDPNPKRNGHESFSLGSGSECTVAGHETCSWKLEGSSFYMSTEENKNFWAERYVGKLRGRIIEGSISFLHKESARDAVNFRAEMDESAGSPGR